MDQSEVAKAGLPYNVQALFVRSRAAMSVGHMGVGSSIVDVDVDPLMAACLVMVVALW